MHVMDVCLRLARGVGLRSVLPAPLRHQRRAHSALTRLLDDPSDKYLSAVRAVDLCRIAAVALADGEGPRHLWEGLAATNAALRAQVEDCGATEEERDAAAAVYAEVARRNIKGIVSPREWCDEWEKELEEFRVIFRATGDERVL